jgi:hypothetical protein
MRRHATALVLAGITILAIAAAVEAVRDDAPRQAGAPGTTYEPPDPSEELSERGTVGTLYLTRRIGGGCRFLALRLPDLAAEADILTPYCEVEAAPDGPAVALGSSCPGTFVEVRDLAGRLLERRRRGCAPSWTPDGRLTLVRNGAVALAGGRVLLSRKRFRSEIAKAPYLPREGSYSIRDAGWLTDATLVLVARHRTTDAANDFLAIFERGRLAPTTGVNQAGTLGFMYVSQQTEEIVTTGRLWDYWDRRGNYLRERRGVFGAYEAFARSPDRRWTATAGRDSIYIFPSDEEVRPIDPVEIRIADVVDLAWG